MWTTTVVPEILGYKWGGRWMQSMLYALPECSDEMGDGADSTVSP